jgi:hypothetical protein
MKRMFFLWAVTVCFVIASVKSVQAQTATSIPQQISYQGVLTQQDGRTTVPDGTYSITFRIFTDQATLNSIWQETQQNVTVQNGIFSVNLGAVAPLSVAFDRQYWLGINIRSSAVSVDFTDRIQFTASPYAIRSRNAEHLLTPNTPTDGQVLRWSASQNRWVASNSSVYVQVVANPQGFSDTRVERWIPYSGDGVRPMQIIVPERGVYLVCHQASLRLVDANWSNNVQNAWFARVFNVTSGTDVNGGPGGGTISLINANSGQIITQGLAPMLTMSTGVQIVTLAAGDILEMQYYVATSGNALRGPYTYSGNRNSISILKIGE